MSTNRNLLKSPVGSIHWMSAAKPKEDKKTGKSFYSIKLGFQTVAKEESEAKQVEANLAYLNQVSEINDAKVVTAATYKGKPKSKSYAATKAVLDQGIALVEIKSIYKPEVFDAAGNPMEDVPYFFEESTGTAQMIAEPWVGDKGGTLNLVGIVIHTISSPETSTTGTGVDRETRLAQLRELAKQE